MATEASALPPSTASTSAGVGSSAASERNSRGSPAPSFSIGITMATPVITLGLLPQPRPERQVVRTVEVGEGLQHGEKTQENSLSKRPIPVWPANDGNGAGEAVPTTKS
jgi:hypothetical protein